MVVKLKLNNEKHRNNFYFFFIPKTMGSSMVDVKARGWTLWPPSTMPNLVLDVWILRINDQDRLNRSGNYCCSSIRVAFMDENKNSHRKITMIHTQTTSPSHIALRAGKKGWVLLRLVPWPQCSKNQLQSLIKNY